jgi:predicted amidohydrolase YtcJ
VSQVEQAAGQAAPGAWILGRGWHQDKWEVLPEPHVEGYPVHRSLSAVSPDTPVLLVHASGHASMVNARALELAGIGGETPDPPGGTILRDRWGQATGLLRETAQRGVREVQAQDAAAEREATTLRAIALARDECLQKGVTSFQDAGSDFFTIDLVRRVAEAGDLGLRLWTMLRVSDDELAERAANYRMIGVADDHLTVRAIKRSIDGALGAHGALLLEPYADLPESAGLNTYELADLRHTAEIAMRHDMQLCVHAIGDRGNRETLDVFAEQFQRHPEKDDLRWRIEHAQHLHPDDIPRFAELGVIASMQAVHCTSDAPWVPTRLGEQRSREGAYVWRSLLDSGAVVTNGTDAPVEDVDPLPSFYAAVTRALPGGGAFHPEQRMSRLEALRSYTTAAAYAAFEEGIKGKLAPGMLADVVVLSRDILAVPEQEILGTEVVYTIVGGKVLYAKEGG